MACLVVVFATLAFHHYYPSTQAYSLMAFTVGAAAAVYGFKQLWKGLSRDYISATLVVLTFLVAVVLPIVQWVLQRPSLFISALIFGGLLIGALRDRLPSTVESNTPTHS